MLLALFCAVLAVALCFPETQIGGALRRLLIDEPARRLSKLRRGHALLIIAVFLTLAAGWLIGRDEGMQVASRATAETLANTIGLGFDLATWLDVMSVTLAISASVRFRDTIRSASDQSIRLAVRFAKLAIRLFALLTRSRAPRVRPRPKPWHSEDPDGAGPTFALA